MVLREAYDDAVGIIVSGAPVPAFIDIGRSDLYGSEGDAGTEEGMAVGGRADIRIDIGDEEGFFSDGGGRCGAEGG